MSELIFNSLTFQALGEGEFSQVPQTNRTIHTTTRSLISVLREGQAAHGGVVTGQGVRVLHCTYIPNAQRSGGRASAQDETVGMEGGAGVLSGIGGGGSVRSLQE